MPMMMMMAAAAVAAMLVFQFPLFGVSLITWIFGSERATTARSGVTDTDVITRFSTWKCDVWRVNQNLYMLYLASNSAN